MSLEFTHLVGDTYNCSSIHAVKLACYHHMPNYTKEEIGNRVMAWPTCKYPANVTITDFTDHNNTIVLDAIPVEAS